MADGMVILLRGPVPKVTDNEQLVGVVAHRRSGDD